MAPPSPLNPGQCQHTAFQCSARISRDVDTGTGKVYYTGIFNVMCSQCKCPMSFVGCDKGGGLVNKPTTDVLGMALSAPLIPGLDLMKDFFKPAPLTPLLEAQPKQGAPLTDDEKTALEAGQKIADRFQKKEITPSLEGHENVERPEATTQS